MEGEKNKFDFSSSLTSVKGITLAKSLKTYYFWIFSLGMCSSSAIITGFTFHVSSKGDLAGISRMEAFSIFLPMSIISIISHFIAGWISDKIPLKYLLIILVSTLGIGCLEFWNSKRHYPVGWSFLVLASKLAYGGCLSIVSWPRFYGRKHMGSINGVFMGAVVFASAIGPAMFGLSENQTGNYSFVARITFFFNILLLAGTIKATNHNNL